MIQLYDGLWIISYRLGVNASLSSILSSSVNSSQPHYSHANMYQQSIATPYIPPYQPPNISTGSKRSPIQEQADPSSGIYKLFHFSI